LVAIGNPMLPRPMNPTFITAPFPVRIPVKSRHFVAA
jgi:hypothetical protein